MKKVGITLSNKAFSLIEVVYAVFIFAYVIVGVFGLLSIALMSVRSTINETIVNNFQCSIAGLWDVAPRYFRTSADMSNQIDIPNIGKILLYGDKVFYLTNEGTITTNTSKAAIKVDYKTTDRKSVV